MPGTFTQWILAMPGWAHARAEDAGAVEGAHPPRVRRWRLPAFRKIWCFHPSLATPWRCDVAPGRLFLWHLAAIRLCGSGIAATPQGAQKRMSEYIRGTMQLPKHTSCQIEQLIRQRGTLEKRLADCKPPHAWKPSSNCRDSPTAMLGKMPRQRRSNSWASAHRQACAQREWHGAVP